jgi:WAS family protein 1
MTDMTNLHQSYEISLVYNNLELSETLEDTFYSIEHLNTIIKDIFQKIDNRIGQEKSRLDNIKKRTAICSDKVRQLKGSNQAVTVFSTAKYPAPKHLPPSNTLLGDVTEVHSLFRLSFILL